MNGSQWNRQDGMEPSRSMEPAGGRKKRKKWPLLIMGAGASVTIWSGWVGLGRMTGFGDVHPLPGIWDSFHLNTAITLPVGMEAYAAYGIGVWLDRDNPARARNFAKWSSLAALALGMTGQAAYHELVASHHAAAPGWLVVAVACLPVVIVAMAAILHHLQGEEDGETDAAPAGGCTDLAPRFSVPAPVVICSASLQPHPKAPMARPTAPLPAIEAPLAVPPRAGSMGAVPVEPVAPPVGSMCGDGTDKTEPVPSPRAGRAPKPRVIAAGNRAPQVVGNRVVTLQDLSSLLPRAIELNDAWRAAHGRNISGETLGQRLGIHKATALALLREIKGAEAGSGGVAADHV